MKKSDMSKRNYRYEAVRNYKYETHEMNEDGQLIKTSDLSEAEWKENVIKQLSDISSNCEVWFVFHDRDIANELGEIKPLHVHIIVEYNDGKYYHEVMSHLHCNENELNKLHNKVGMYRYLTHTTEKSMNEHKCRYEVDELYYYKLNKLMSSEEKHNDYREKIAGKEKKEDDKKFIDDMLFKVQEGMIGRKDIRKIFIDEFGDRKGASLYSKNRKALLDAIDDYQFDYLSEMRRGGRRLVTIYIDGASGLGKTYLATKICEYQNLRVGRDQYDYYNASSTGQGLTKDLFQKYKNEYSTIIDEYMPEETHQFSEFNHVFNGRNIVEVASRNNTKPWFSELCVISKSRSVEDTIEALVYTATPSEIFKDKENLKHQVARRLQINILLHEVGATVRVYNMEKREYEVAFEYKDNLRKSGNLEKFLYSLDEVIWKVRDSIVVEENEDNVSEMKIEVR